jgi:o-succinylbenzoate synthase
MYLNRIELFHIRMRLQQPFETSFGVEQDRDCILVRVEGDGAVGWGECVASMGPWYSYETTDTAWHILTSFLIPIVIRSTQLTPESVPALFQPVRGHNMAKAGLEMALWDLDARQHNIALSKRLGGERDRVPVGVSVGIQPSLEQLVDQVRSFVQQGYGRIKIKIKPGWDVEVAQTLRRTFPDLPIQVDANSAYRLKDAAVFEAMDDLGLLLIEQPLAHDDIYEHHKLQQRLATPICLDESIHSVADAAAALELGSCRNINIKPGRVGGHAASRQIHDLCLSRQVPVWHGGMLETGIGRAHNVALASLQGFVLPGDISASDRYYAQDIVEPAFRLNADSTISVPTGPGIGVEVNEQQIRSMALRHAAHTL